MTFEVQNRIIQGKSLQKHWVFSKKSLFRYRENTKVRLRTPSQPIFWQFPSNFEIFEPIFGALFLIPIPITPYMRIPNLIHNHKNPTKKLKKRYIWANNPRSKIYCVWTTLKIGFCLFFIQQSLYVLLYIVLYYIWYYL